MNDGFNFPVYSSVIDYLLLVLLLCRVLELADKQIATFAAMFSWPQFVTALIGSAIALVNAPRVKKSLK